MTEGFVIPNWWAYYEGLHSHPEVQEVQYKMEDITETKT